MSQVRIVIDSTADIPQELREKLGIEMVPLRVQFGNTTYLDAITISSEQFYEKLAASTALPTTSQPSPADYLETFRRLAEEPETEIICISLAASLSGTYQAAMLAKSMLEEEAKVTVVDSRSASYGIGMLAVRAAEAASQGKSVAEIVDLVVRLRNQTKLYFVVDTLDYLHKGGRIGRAAALFGSLLNIKPILTIDDEGVVTSIDKVRGQRKAMARIAELLREAPYAGSAVEIVIAHANAPAMAEELGALLREQLHVQSLQYTSIGPVIGTHAGPGAIGIFMLPV